MNKISDILKEFEILIRKPKLIIVSGEGRRCAKEAITKTLNPYFKIGKDIFVFDINLKEKKEIEKIKSLIYRSSLPILVITHFGEIPFDKYFFASDSEEIKLALKLAQILPVFSHLILNFDDESVREIKDKTNLNELTFGFQDGANFKATDVKLNHGTNFKVVFKGNIVPFWMEGVFGKEQIYSGLAAITVGNVLGLNLVEISQGLKNYSSLPGKMKLIEGIKNSWIIDNSDAGGLFLTIEALEILGKTEWAKRRIAVLGDVFIKSKYTIEAHESIGEKAAKNSDLIFTFGQKAKFIAKSAFENGLPEKNIYHFDKNREGAFELQRVIKEGDLILVNASKEANIKEIVDEIKKI